MKIRARFGGGNVASLLLAVVLLAGCQSSSQKSSGGADSLYVSRMLLPAGTFTDGVEGPAVDRAGNLYAVNYQHPHTIGQILPDGTARVFVTLPDSSIGNGIRFGSRGQMLVADYTRHNVLQVDPADGTVRVFAHEPKMNQPNDLAIDAADRLYASDPSWADSTGQLWRIDPDGHTTLLEADMGTTNGIEVSPDERTLYVNESVQRRIWAYDLSPEGQISDKRLFASFADYGLDGMRTDVVGNLYVARFGKGTVAKLSPTGEVLREIKLTGSKPTNIAFGGSDGRTCYVTVADRGTIEKFRVDEPGRSWQLRQRRHDE